ncbi:unnamed protein product [Calypogeia fissa]
MADGQILLVRSLPQSAPISVTRIGITGVKQYQQQLQSCLRRVYLGEGRVRKGSPNHHHRHYHHHQQRQELKRLGEGIGWGFSRSSRLCRFMASGAEEHSFSSSSSSSSSPSSASESESHRRFQSYSVPSENWRAKKQGGHIPQPRGNGRGEIPQHLNGSAASSNGSILSPIPLEKPEDCEAKAATLEFTAHSLRPKRIILVRHGQSEGNVDESAYTRIPDSKICLTEDGWKQAILCGKRIREIIEKDKVDDWKVYFYVSPYRRTLQTLRGIGLAFERERIAGVREEPRIREQDFGNFQDREKMRVEKEVRLRYGRFFYRFPNGESAADVYDRITGFRETLRADVDVGRFQRPESRSKNMNLVMVSHGLTLRVFLMRWYKWTVEQFEGLWNFGNTGMMVMELGPGGRYSLTMHHSAADLKAFGMTDEMIADQEWQKYAQPGELNYDWLTSGSSFFTHYDDLQNGTCNEIPPDIMLSVLGAGGELNPEPPRVE